MNKDLEDAIYDMYGAQIATDIDNEILTEIIGNADSKILFTSNYARCGSHPQAVSVSASAPDYFTGEHLKALAPPWDLLMAYKDGKIDEEEYALHYIDTLEAVRNLDPKEVFAAIPNGTILLCYEKPGDFCHRRILAKWLGDANNTTIREWVSETEAEKERIVDDLLGLMYNDTKL